MELGGPEWNVELVERQLDHALWKTLSLFNKYIPTFQWSPLGFINGTQSFDYSDQEVGVKVVDVKFKSDDSRYSRPFYLLGRYGFYNLREPRRLFKALVADDRYNSFLGLHPTWKWDPEERKLWILVDSPITGVRGTALLLIPKKVDEIPYFHEYDFHEAAVGHTKRLLARVLRKYGAIPGAQGNITLDANELAQEGEAAVKEVTARLDKNPKRTPPRPIF